MASLHPQPHMLHHPSPKRKRATSASDPTAVHPFAPRLVVETATSSTVEPTSNSPRTAVARQLQTLQIRPIPSPPLFGEAWARHKRLRQTDGMDIDESDVDAPTVGISINKVSQEKLAVAERIAPLDAGRKSGVKPATPSLMPTSNLRGIVLSRSPSPYALDAESGSISSRDTSSTEGCLPDSARSSPSRYRNGSPSPPTPISAPILATTTIITTSNAAASPSPSRQSQTWQDAEITGHLLLDPEDDGTGINGIGFKPTPAVAWARSQRRKKQLADWRAREAREARARRNERRNRLGATLGGSTGGAVTHGTIDAAYSAASGVSAEDMRRVVRFA